MLGVIKKLQLSYTDSHREKKIKLLILSVFFSVGRFVLLKDSKGPGVP